MRGFLPSTTAASRLRRLHFFNFFQYLSLPNFSNICPPQSYVQMYASVYGPLTYFPVIRPLGGTNNRERPRLNHSCPSPGNKEDRRSRLSKERRGRICAKKVYLVESTRYLGATRSWISRIRRKTLYSMRAEIASQ